MSYKITVVNQTGLKVWVGLDNWQQNGRTYGFRGDGQLAPAASSGFVVSGAGPYNIGFVTVISGYPNMEMTQGTPTTMVYNVYAGSKVTLAAELAAPQTLPVKD